MGFSPKNKKIFFALLTGLIVVGGFFVFSNHVLAATSYSVEDIGGQTGLATVDLKVLVINIIKWVLGIISLVAVSLLIYGGVLWMTSKGNEEKIAKAKKVIINTLIGMVIILLAWAIVLLVERFVTGSSSSDGISCDPGVVHPSDICRECNSTGDGYIYIIPLPAGCTLPGAEFRVNDMQTSHEGDENDKEVYMCSRIQPIFNNNVNGETVIDAVADLNNPLEIVNIDADPDAPKTGTWTTASKSITFKHPKQCTVDPANDCSEETEISACETGGGTCELVLFEALTNYEVHLPNIIEDKSALPLSWSVYSPLFCTDSGDYVTCSFRTSNLNDTEPPQIVSTYPISTGINYPDRNVSREPIIDVNFSESIDATTVVDIASPPHPNSNNIVLQRLDSQGDLNPDETIDSSLLEISEKDNGFRLSLIPPNALEAFTWYRITVQNIEDLCGNQMTGNQDPENGSYIWEFQTNDKVAGFQSWYPTGTNVCPETKISVTFNTTMFNNIVSFEVNGQQVIMDAPANFIGDNPDYVATDTFGTLRIINPVPGNPASLDPDNAFRVYELMPANPLSTNTDYLVQVRTDRVIDSEGGVLEKDWTFRVTTPEDCACEPRISYLSPEQGGRGECITIYGDCFTGTDYHTAAPTSVKFDNTEAGIESSGEDYIVTTSPDSFILDDRPLVTFDITYYDDYGNEDPTYGILTSNGVPFWYETEEEATGPCLLSVNPDYGYPGITGVRLEGIRFEPSDAIRNVTFDSGTLNSGSITSWSDTRIDTSVPASGTEANDGDVNVHNNAGDSNGIPFDIREFPPGIPFVSSFWPNCDSACINTLPGAQFNIEMDSSTINDSNISMSACADSNCEYSGLNGLNISIAYNLSDRIITLEPADYLLPDAWYRVIISENVLGSEGTSIGNLNFDTDGDGSNDSFSWSFKTKNDSTPCAISSADVSPATRTVGVGSLVDYRVYAYGSPDECNPTDGQMLSASAYDWTWNSSDSGLATITNNVSESDSGLGASVQRAEALAETTGVQISASTENLGITYSDYGVLTITEDPTCVTDQDCAINELGEACPGSVCLDNRCTPVINWFSPMEGGPSTWVTVAGCWFGNYVEGKSSVYFNSDPDKEGELLPDYCGPNTWTNNRILREVPDDVTSGSQDPITVQGGDSGDYTYTIASPDNFTVNNNTEIPGICLLDPAQGKEVITSVQIRGKNFGDTQETNDWVVYNNTNLNNNVQVTDYSAGPWTSTNVWTNVPFGVGVGTAEVTLYNNDISSNPWPFTVLSPTCAICSSDTDCLPDQGCGSDGCCYARPQITSTIPEDSAMDVCGNTLIEVNFDQDMDTSTLNTANITMTRPSASGPVLIDLTGRLSVYSRRVRINHDLLEANTPYTISLSNGIKSKMGVGLAADYSFSFTTISGNTLCEISKLNIAPSYYTFTKRAPYTDPVTNLSLNPKDFIVYAQDSRGYAIFPIPDVYDWSWHWSSLDENIVSVTDSDNWQQTATGQKNGSTRIKVLAEAVAGWEGSKEAYAGVEVAFCDMSWVYDDSASCDIPGDDCSNYNFSLSYCQGNYGLCEGTNEVCSNDYQANCPSGEICCLSANPICKFSTSVLPNLDLQVVRGKSGDVLKQYLFKESGRCTEGNAYCTVNGDCASGVCEVTNDGIGIRIYANLSNLSPADWYKQNIENLGSPQSLTVDGYQAVRDGRTIYVAATNYSPPLYTNIYLISYNDNASSETVSVYNRLVQNWRFNTNIDSLDKEYITRDVRRLSDLVKIAGYLNDYRQNKTASESQNFLQNPGFEDSLNNWSATSNVNRVDGEKYEGEYAAHLTGVSGSQQYIVQDVPVTLGKVYEVTAWLKANLTSGTNLKLLTQCRVPDPNNAGDYIFEWDYDDCNLVGISADKFVEGNSSWVKRTEYVYANRSDALLRVGCSLSTSATSSDEGWCDSFSVRETEAPYPALEAGSYIPNMSTSKWPSWQANLGNTLGKSLPVDPLNILIDCPADFSEPSACWDEPSKEFICNTGSNIYAYKTNHGLDYTLYANLETDSTYWTGISSSISNICPPSTCECFDYTLSSP